MIECFTVLAIALPLAVNGLVQASRMYWSWSASELQVVAVIAGLIGLILVVPVLYMLSILQFCPKLFLFRRLRDLVD